MTPPITEAEIKAANPFNAGHLTRLEEMERKIEVFNELAERGERCGLKCESQRAVMGEIGRSIIAIKREFLSEFLPGRNPD